MRTLGCDESEFGFESFLFAIRMPAAANNARTIAAAITIFFKTLSNNKD